MTETLTEKKKPGPVPGPEMKQYTMMLPPELGEWGKVQPHGLADLVRRLLREEKDRQAEAKR